jgi:DNA primase
MRGLNVARETLQGEESVSFDPRGMMRYTGMLDMDIRVVSLPEGKDPDDLIRDHPEAWEALIARAIPVADYVIQQGTAHLGSNASYHEREVVARELLPILTATESDLQRNGSIQALARRVRIDERTLIQWTQRRRSAEVRTMPSIREQRRLAERTVRSLHFSGPPGQSIEREAFCLHLLIQEPERLFVINRKLRELHGQDTRLAEVLDTLSAEDFSRPDYQVIFREIEKSLYQDELDPVDYLFQVLPPELNMIVGELKAPRLEGFRQTLQGALGTELQSIQRDQARTSTLPEPDTTLFVREALELRYCRLKRESRELYFMQQDAEANGLTDQTYGAAMEANRRARLLIEHSTAKVKSFFRRG